MPGLSAKMELELLEEKVEKLVERITNPDSNFSTEEKDILLKEYDSIIANICILVKILQKL